MQNNTLSTVHTILDYIIPDITIILPNCFFRIVQACNRCLKFSLNLEEMPSVSGCAHRQSTDSPRGSSGTSLLENPLWVSCLTQQDVTVDKLYSHCSGWMCYNTAQRSAVQQHSGRCTGSFWSEIWLNLKKQSVFGFPCT